MEPKSDIRIGMNGDRLAIFVEGRGMWGKSKAMKDVVAAAVDEGVRHIFLDMSACTYIDSTFIGSLVAIALRAKERWDGHTIVYGVGEKIKTVLVTMGIHLLIELREEHNAALKSEFGDTVSIDNIEATKLDELTHLIETHQLLERVDPGNTERFKHVKEVLAQALENEKKKQGLS